MRKALQVVGFSNVCWLEGMRRAALLTGVQAGELIACHLVVQRGPAHMIIAGSGSILIGDQKLHFATSCPGAPGVIDRRLCSPPQGLLLANVLHQLGRHLVPQLYKSKRAQQYLATGWGVSQYVVAAEG